MTDILNYQRYIKEQEKTESRELDQLKNDVTRVFGSSEGKRILYHVLAMCGIYSDCFTGNAHTYYYEGRRSVGLELLELIMETDPEIYIQLIRENADARS